MTRFCKIITLLLSSVLSTMHASAFCTASDVIIDFEKNINIQRDVPVGAVLAKFSTSNIINCEKSGQVLGDGSWYVRLSKANIDNGASPIAGVRKTNIDGIGIRWLNHNSYTNADSEVSARSLNDSSWKRGISLDGITTFTDTFELVKTAATPKTETLSMIIGMEYSAPSNSDVANISLFRYIIPTIHTNTVSCMVLDNNLNIDMGIAVSSRFNGVGSVANPVDFTIKLSCDEQTSVNVVLDARDAHIADVENGVLGLNSASTAKGIGIQILHNDAVVKYGSQINYGTSSQAGQMVNIPFRAFYYQTSKNIQPGTVNSTATFSMIYQ